jgi:sulfotransferase family protein
MSAEPSALAGASKQRIPDFFIVGHHKSGTTALYEMLRRHPGIYMSDVKEPRYFAGDLRALVGEPPTDGEAFDRYLSLFDAARPDQRVGEASPSYLRSHTAAREIAAVQPAARIIAILREPASFVRSLHLQLVQEHVESEKDLRRAFAAEEIERGGQKVLRYSDHVRYTDQLRRYHSAFGPEQVLVLIYDDFRSDNEQTVRRVLRFLEVDDSHPIEALEANPTVHMRSTRLDSLVRALYGERGPLWSAARAVLPKRARSGALRALRRGVVYGKPPPEDAQLTLELRRRFKGEVVKLGEYLDRDLVGLWGYEHID